MPFIGKAPETGAFRLIDSITTSATDTYALTVQGDHYFPASARNLIVSLNGVTQAPESAYTVSGSHIVFASALTSSDVIDYILVIGDAVDIGTPSDGTVGTAQMSYPLDNFSSTGIDDNATETAITIDANENVEITKQYASLKFNGETTTATLTTSNGVFDAGFSLENDQNSNGVSLKNDGSVALYSSNGTAAFPDMSIATNGNIAMTADLRVDTNTLVVDSTNNRVGIGTGNPAYDMHITNSGATARLGLSNQGSAIGDRQLRMGFSGTNTYAEIQGTRLNTADDVNIAINAGGGRVGIGGEPKEKLHVITASNGLGVVADDSADELVLENTGDTGMTFLSPNTATQTIAFGDTDNRLSGWIEYDHSTNAMAFGTVNASGERLRITSAGHLGIGRPNPQARLDVEGGNQIFRSTSNGYTTFWSYYNTDPFDGATYDRLEIRFDTSNPIVYFNASAHSAAAHRRIAFQHGGSTKLSIDADGLKFNGDSAAANALDDYEEGTWTAHIRDSADGSIRVNSSATSRYIKIGAQVTVYIQVYANSVSAHTFSGTPYISLPFAPANNAGTNGVFGSYYLVGMGTAVSGYAFNSSTFYLSNDATSPFAYPSTGLAMTSGNKRFYGQLTYMVV